MFDVLYRLVLFESNYYRILSGWFAAVEAMDFSIFQQKS
jgi:hypothetical protein